MRFLVLAALCLWCCSAAALEDPDNLDVKLFRSVNNARSDFMTGVSNIVDYSVYPVSAALPLGFFGYGILADTSYEKDTGLLMASSELLAILIYAPLKSIFQRSRPYVSLENVHTGHLETTSRYSFPSGHSSLAMSVATMLCLRYPRPEVYLPAFTWAILVGYSRIYFGLHYPGDVVAGTVIGVGSALLIHHFSEQILSVTNLLFHRRTSVRLSPISGGVQMTLAVKLS